MNAGMRRSRDSIRRHSKSFFLASRFLPGEARDRAISVYAWCRRADDAVDLAASEQQAVALARLRSELEGIMAGAQSHDPVLDLFRRTVAECRIPPEYPEELLAGMSMDVEGRTYRTTRELLEYCHRVAGVVGLMMCHVMGVRDDRALRNAAHLGMAMQLTNICRDVLEDWERGRLYLPARMVDSHGFRDLAGRLGDPFPNEARRAVAGAVGDLLGEAERLYASGDAGVPALSWRCAIAIRTARRVYSAIGSRVRQRECDPLAGRAFVSMWGKLTLTTAALMETILEAPSRTRRGRGTAPTTPGRVLRFPEDILPIEVGA